MSAAASVAGTGELTYTSFDGRGVGGWQVKDHRGLSPEELDVLRTRIDPQLDTGTELPRFPSPEDVEQFPRRLVFAPEPPSPDTISPDTISPETISPETTSPGVEGTPAVAWWHHASAGLDGSGRPGNVFAHVLLDRHPGRSRAGALIRPVDLWRSTGWLTPYGPDAVLAATLGPAQPGPGAEISATRLIAWLLDPDHYRLGVLSVLLDACAAAVRGGPPVVLASDTTDSAAWWVAAVTHLMSVAAAERFGFSTLERLASLPNRFAQGLRLCCVPRADYDTLRQEDRPFVLVAEDDAVSVGDLDGARHTTGAGDRVAVTEWSVLAKVILIDEATAVWALSQLDDVARQVDEVADPARDELAWPLAMVVARAPEHFGDGIPEASRVLVRRSPGALRAAPDLFDSAQALIADSLGPTTADVWEPLERALSPGEPLTVMGEMLLSIYVRHAVVDASWLARPGGPPVPAARWRDGAPADVAGAVRAGVDTLLAAEPDDREAAIALAALADFGLQLDLVTPELLDRIAGGLERSFVHLLFEPASAELVESMNTFAETTLRTLVRPLVANLIGLEPAPLGQRLSPAVLHWLHPHGIERVVPDRHEPYEGLRLRAELAVQMVREDASAAARERPLAVLALLEEGAAVTEVEPWFAGDPWTVAELTAVESRFPGRLPLTVFAPTFKSADPGPPLHDLGTILLQARRTAEAFDPYGPGDLIPMRLTLDDAWWRSQGDALGSAMSLVLSGAVHALTYADVPFHPDVWDHLRAAMVLAIAGVKGSSVGVGRAPTGVPLLNDVRRLVDAEDGPARAASATVLDIVSEAAAARLKLEQVVVAALLGDPGFPVSEIASPLDRWANRVRVPAGERRSPVLRECVASEVAQGHLTLDGLADRVHSQLWFRVGAVDHPDRAHRACTRFANGWLKSLFAAEGVRGRLR